MKVKSITVERVEEGINVHIPDGDSIGAMSILCEGLVFLMKVAKTEGRKEEFASLRDCIRHLKSGYSDKSFKVKAGG